MIVHHSRVTLQCERKLSAAGLFQEHIKNTGKLQAFAIDKTGLPVYKHDHILVSRGVCTNTGYCPKMSKDANGYTRYCRLKALPNVAGFLVR
jgi:hypothetical protein